MTSRKWQNGCHYRETGTFHRNALRTRSARPPLRNRPVLARALRCAIAHASAHVRSSCLQSERGVTRGNLVRACGASHCRAQSDIQHSRSIWRLMTIYRLTPLCVLCDSSFTAILCRDVNDRTRRANGVRVTST